MNRYKWMIAGLLALALGLVVYMFTGPKESVEPESGDQAPAVKQQAGRPKSSGAVQKGAAEQDAKAASRREIMKKRATQSALQPKADKAVPVVTEPKDIARKAAAEAAVAEWETLVDKLVETTDAPNQERKAQVKEAFDKLDKADQMDAVQRSLNLLPNEQFTSLFGILYDKAENPEVLDAIFSDALNRPEEIKVPMMKDLVKDKTHPMFFESARILDVTGELEKMAQGDKKEADDDVPMAEAPPEEEEADEAK